MNREQGVSKSAEKTKKSGKIASPKITANIFLCFPPGTIWFSKRKCWFAHVNGQTKQLYVEEDSSDGDANSLPPGHFLFRISSILRSEVRVALSFSLLMRSSEKCMPPKYYRIELKDTGNCVHISNIKDTSIQYIQ